MNPQTKFIMSTQELNPITEFINFFKNVDYDKLLGYAGGALNAIKNFAVTGSKETTRIMLELYYVMMSEQTSKFDKFLIGAALAYQLMPNDFMPQSKYGLLSFLDNAGALMYAYKKVQKAVTPDITQQVEDTLCSWGRAMDDFTIMKPENERV